MLLTRLLPIGTEDHKDFVKETFFYAPKRCEEL